jgi:hypothetical protein
VEFGAKLSASWIDEYVFLDNLSWNNFNESGDLQEQLDPDNVGTQSSV